MKSSALLVALLGLVLAGCGDPSQPKSQTATTTPTNTGPSPLSAPADYLGAIGAAKTLAEKTIDLAQINQAIQLFVAQESRNPKSLDELVEAKFLVQIPKAPYGKKIVYDAATGKVSVVNAK